MSNNIQKGTDFIQTVVEVAKARKAKEFLQEVCNEKSQAEFLENMKSFTATDRTGSGNTPATGSGFLQVNSTPIQTFSPKGGLKNAILERGFEFSPNGRVSGSFANGFIVETPTLTFSDETRYKTFDQNLDLDDTTTVKGLSTYNLLGHRYVVNLPYNILQGVSANHNLTDMYNIYRQRDVQDQMLLMDKILIDKMSPLVNTSITNGLLSTQPNFPLIATIFDLESILHDQGVESVAVALNFKQAQKLKTELLQSGVRTSNLGGTTTGSTINDQSFSIEKGNGAYFGTIGGVEVFRTRGNLIKNTYTVSSGAITANTGGNNSAMFAFDPSAIANHKGNPDYDSFEVTQDQISAIKNNGPQLGAVTYAGGVVIEASRATYATFTA